MGYSIKKVDSNQKGVVKALRDAGASIAHTHTLGRGFPDFVIGLKGLSLVGEFDVKELMEAIENVKGVKVISGVNILVELKDGKKPQSAQKLTSDEEKWHEDWVGNVEIVKSEHDAIRLISATDKDFNSNCLAAKLDPKAEKFLPALDKE